MLKMSRQQLGKNWQCLWGVKFIKNLSNRGQNAAYSNKCFYRNCFFPQEVYIPSIFAINRTDEQFIWITKFQLKSCTATRTPWLAQGLFPNTPWDWLQVKTLWTRTLAGWQRPPQRSPIRLPWQSSLKLYSEMQDQNGIGQGRILKNCTGVGGVDLEAHTRYIYICTIWF